MSTTGEPIQQTFADLPKSCLAAHILALEYRQPGTKKGFRMKTILALLLLSPMASLAQSPFDGTWIIDTSTNQPPQKLTLYSLAKGQFRGPAWATSIKADGNDQQVPANGYWDTISVRIVDDHTVEIVYKKAGKVMFNEVNTVSPDGNTLTQVVKDTTEAEAVTIETHSKRVGQQLADSHAISGSWQVVKVKRSENSSIISYKCTADGFSAETPLGEKFDAKFDGKFYPVEDDPGHTMVSLRLINANTVEQTGKRDGKIISVMTLTVAPDGKSIHVVRENKEDNTTGSFEMRKKP